MKDHEYHALTDAFFQYVEDTVDAGYPDIDCERAGGVLTLSFENKTKVIINKQEPLTIFLDKLRSNGEVYGYYYDTDGAIVLKTHR